jgi:AcrR family transcriptional regulator
MARRSDHTRDELRELALAAAERIVTKEGPAGLTTRAVATQMGYTVGSLYLVFQNLDDLVLQLNGRTLEEMSTALQAGLADCGNDETCLLVLAQTYIRFAFEHEARWRLIFEHPMESPAPEWFSAQVARAFALVEERLLRLAPHRGRAAAHQAALALWSGVHGVCVLGLTRRLDTDGVDSVQALAASLITHYLAGYTAGVTNST